MAVLTHLSSPQSSLWTLCGMAGSVADRLVGVWWRLASSGAGDQLLAGQVAANWLLATCLNIYQLLAGCAAVYLLLPGCGMETGCWYTDWFVLTLGHWVAGSELVTPKKTLQIIMAACPRHRMAICYSWRPLIQHIYDDKHDAHLHSIVSNARETPVFSNIGLIHMIVAVSTNDGSCLCTHKLCFFDILVLSFFMRLLLLCNGKRYM